MKQYIDKSALVAEIERRIADNKKDIERASHKNLEDYFEGYEDALVLFKEKFLDTLEVKEVEEELVSNDLEEAAKNHKSAIHIVSPQWIGEVEKAFKAGAEWQKEQMIIKACEYLEEHKEVVETEDNGIMGRIPDYFIKDFRKAMEE